jgi:hypothetical protein
MRYFSRKLVPSVVWIDKCGKTEQLIVLCLLIENDYDGTKDEVDRIDRLSTIQIILESAC